MKNIAADALFYILVSFIVGKSKSKIIQNQRMEWNMIVKRFL